jgi:hypothetical protein
MQPQDAPGRVARLLRAAARERGPGQGALIREAVAIATIHNVTRDHPRVANAPGSRLLPEHALSEEATAAGRPRRQERRAPNSTTTMPSESPQSQPAMDPDALFRGIAKFIAADQERRYNRVGEARTAR